MTVIMNKPLKNLGILTTNDTNLKVLSLTTYVKFYHLESKWVAWGSKLLNDNQSEVPIGMQTFAEK